MTDSREEPSPSEGGDDQTRTPVFKGATRKLVFEFVIVLLLLVAPSVVSGVSYLISPWESSPRSLSGEVYGVMWNLGAIGLLFYFACGHGQNLRVLGLRPTRWWKELTWGVLILWAVWFSSNYAGVISLLVGLPLPPEGDAVVEPVSALTAILPVTLLVNAFFEEILFRAYLWNWLTHFTSRPVVSLFLCAGLFALGHTGSPAVLLGHFIFGLILGVFFWAGRSVPRVVLAHWAFNLAVIYVSTYWIAPSDPVPVVNAEYLTIKPVSTERSEIYTEEAVDPATGQQLYVSDEILLDLTHVNCTTANLERSERESEGWSVTMLLTPEGQRARAEWSGDRVAKSVGIFIQGKLLYDATIAGRVRDPQMLIFGLSQERAEEIRDAIASGGRPP